MLALPRLRCNYGIASNGPLTMWVFLLLRYDHLAPSMIESGQWNFGDDTRLLRAMLHQGAQNEWDVDWPSAVQGRTGAQVCGPRLHRLVTSGVHVFPSCQLDIVVNRRMVCTAFSFGGLAQA